MDDQGELARIRSSKGYLLVGHDGGEVTVAGHRIGLAAAADLEIALDEAVAQARAWADERKSRD